MTDPCVPATLLAIRELDNPIRKLWFNPAAYQRPSVLANNQGMRPTAQKPGGV